MRESIRSRDALLQREFLHALERARGRLAVAVAAENKFTPRERWRRYLETEDRLRACVREIRNRRGVSRQFAWLKALDLLRQPLPVDESASGEASLLLQRLFAVLEIIGTGVEAGAAPRETDIFPAPDGQ